MSNPPVTSTSPAEIGFSWRGRAALGVFGLHTLLLFFPPIPPDVKGSLWSYILSTLAVIIAALEVRRLRSAIAWWWSGIRAVKRVWVGLIAVGGALLIAFLIRALTPDLFARFSREEGVWEPVTLACYLAGLVLVWQMGSALDGVKRRHFRLISGAYVWLVLEEIDYASVFGGVIGRVDGVYVGALHDLINLSAVGLLTATTARILVLATAVVVLWLWRAGYVQPRMIRQTLQGWGCVWLLSGFGLLSVGAIEETGLLGVFAAPSPEEAFEMAGGICILIFALQTVSDAQAWMPGPDEP